MSFSNYLEEKVLEHVFGGTPFTAPATLYVGLLTSTSTDTGPGTEITGNGYARVAVDPADLTVTAGEPSQIANNNVIEFAAATGAGWGNITHVAIFDADTAGNMLVHGAATTAKVINSGDTYRFPANAFKITLD